MDESQYHLVMISDKHKFKNKQKVNKIKIVQSQDSSNVESQSMKIKHKIVFK